MAKEDDQRLKDMMRAIELGEIEEDILEGDPEDYDNMGGINSLKKGAPSIKLASETGPEEFELELMSVIREFNDRMQKGELDPNTTVDEYINDYLSRKRMMMENRQMAMYGGRMQYAGGNEDPRMIAEPPEAMKKDTTTGEGANIFNMYYDDQDIPIKKEGDKLDLDIEKIKKLIEKRKKEKAKRAKGGIAGVL